MISLNLKSTLIKNKLNELKVNSSILFWNLRRPKYEGSLQHDEMILRYKILNRGIKQIEDELNEQIKLEIESMKMDELNND